MSSNLPLYKNFGSEIKELSPVLANQLSQMYSDIANAMYYMIRKNILTGSDPAVTDQRNTLFSIGDIAVRTDTDSAWIMTSRTTAETVVWTLIS